MPTRPERCSTTPWGRRCRCTAQARGGCEMPAWRWTLTDSVTSQTYQVGTNPHEGGSPTLKKSVAKSNTSAGSPLLMEGQDEAQQASVSGVLLDRATYDAFVDWMTRPRPVAVA